MTVSTDTLLETNAALLGSGDVAGLVARYAPDAQLLHAGGVARGRAEIEAVLSAQAASRPTVLATRVISRSDDTLAYEARMSLEGEGVRVIGSFVLRDGLIWRQTSVVVDDMHGA